jgi:sulfide:quinone oxidoreductase
MFRHCLSKSVYAPPVRFAGGIAAKPQKLGDKTHIETVIVAVGQYLNTGNTMLGAFCKANLKEPVALFSEKTRPVMHEYSKDLYMHLSFKDEEATGKGIFTGPPKGHFYKIDADVMKFEPENNKIYLQDKIYTYDHMILAGEYQFDWDKVKGMEKSIKDFWNSKVVSTAQVHAAKMVWRSSLDFRGGNFVYAFPKSPYKNEGTNHIFMLFDQFTKDIKIEGQWYGSKFIVTSPDTFLHRVPWVNEKLEDMANKRGIEIRYNRQLEEIRYSNILDPHRVSDLVYKNLQTGEQEIINYGSAIVYPEAKVPDVVKQFCDESGHVAVDHYTLTHKKWSNVFSIGEISNIPTVSNCIGVCAQAKVVAGNIGDLKKGQHTHYFYDGVTATPIFTGWHKLIMPGFRYGGEEVNTKLTTDTTTPFVSGIKQALSFSLFKRYEKKWFEKKFQGKIFGPPGWKKYVKPHLPAVEAVKH